VQNFLISGGTDGIGRAVADDALARGHRVVVVGSTRAKGEAFLAQARAAGAGDRATFLQADLTLVTENSRVLAEVPPHLPHVDRLVLCAQRYLTRLTHTREGVETNFALSCLSRHLLAHGLLPELRRSAAPLVVSVCGTATAAGRIHWDDVQFRRRRGGVRALLQAARATDLLGPDFVAHAPDIPYVLFNPDVVRTNLQRELDQPWRAMAMLTLALHGKPVAEGVRPLLALLREPPAAGLRAFRGRRTVPVDSGRFARYYDPGDAARLRGLTEALLAEVAAAG
jgi:NAD(P)-dependent dehydrogenase (short-subunit alcohol dehydrogenase family)